MTIDTNYKVNLLRNELLCYIFMDKVNYEVSKLNIFIKSLNIEHIKYMSTDNNVRIILILMTF